MLKKRTKVLLAVGLVMVGLLFVAGHWVASEPFSIPGINGSTEAAVIRIFGEPEYCDTFALGPQRLHVLRDGLRYLFPEECIAADTIVIRELRWSTPWWDYAVWLQQQDSVWVAVDDLFWSKAIRF